MSWPNQKLDLQKGGFLIAIAIKQWIIFPSKSQWNRHCVGIHQELYGFVL